MSFSSIPILDYSLLSSSEGKEEFLSQFRNALINVGFLYLSNPPVSRADFDAMIAYCPRLFELSTEAKEKINMVNSPHFFGYTRLGAEITKGKTDQREQFDFGTPYDRQWVPGEPEYLRLWGPPQVCFPIDVGCHPCYTNPFCGMLFFQLSGLMKTYYRDSKKRRSDMWIKSRS